MIAGSLRLRGAGVPFRYSLLSGATRLHTRDVISLAAFDVPDNIPRSTTINGRLRSAKWTRFQFLAHSRPPSSSSSRRIAARNDLLCIRFVTETPIASPHMKKTKHSNQIKFPMPTPPIQRWSHRPEADPARHRPPPPSPHGLGRPQLQHSVQQGHEATNHRDQKYCGLCS